MTKPALIGPPVVSTPAELKSSRGRAIPEDLLREASRRLRIMALLGAVLWLVGTVSFHLAESVMHPGTPAAFIGPPDAIAFASILISLALAYFIRRTEGSPQLVLDLGLVYLVITAAALGVINHWMRPAHATALTQTISWIGAVVLMFAAIVPSSPGKFLIAGFIAASMNPIGMLIARHRGAWDFESWTAALLMHYPDYLLVGCGVLISRVVFRLGQQVAKARELGSYQLGELLGRGGMGEVYKATHRMLARPAAIKLMRPEMLGGSKQAMEVAIKRFHREARVAASLRSPHTVELYDFGVTEDDTLYFVMELLEGMDLETLVRTRGPVPASRAIHLLTQACESLAEAHERGLVHRDIKPANIHVGQLGVQRDFVKVLDFGLVKSVATTPRIPGEAEPSLATEAGLALGTPAYMAPEAAFGENVDARSDIYALGCVAYFLLTGQQVFDAETPMQLIMKHVTGKPVAPSQRTDRPIPAALDAVVLSCLSKSPVDRPQSAAALARAMAEVDVESWTEEHRAEWWSAAIGESVRS